MILIFTSKGFVRSPGAVVYPSAGFTQKITVSDLLTSQAKTHREYHAK